MTAFHNLQKHLEMVWGGLSSPRNTWLSPLALGAFGVIDVGTEHLSVWEARIEIDHRSIDYLENH